MSIQARRKRFQDLSKKHPLLADIFDFYSHLYGFLGEERELFLTAVPEKNSPELRRKEGFPLVTGESLLIEADKTRSFLFRLIVMLEEHSRNGFEDLASLKQGIAEKDKLDLPRLFRASLDRDRRPLKAAAEEIGCQPPILEFVLDTALGYALKRCREEGLSVETEGWNEGYCPLCGGVPVMGELAGEEGRKKLHCGTCGTCWEYSRLKCSHCGNDDVQKLEYFTAEGDPGHRVNVCRKCSCYLKLVDSRITGEGLPIDVEDIATLHLDLLAQNEGFTKGKRGNAV